MKSSKSAALSAKRNHKQYRYLKTKEILEKKKGWVGTQGGLKGFIDESIEGIKNGEYQYCEDDGPIGRIPKYIGGILYYTNWATLDCFKQIYNWHVHGETPDEDCMITLKNNRLSLRRRYKPVPKQ